MADEKKGRREREVGERTGIYNYWGDINILKLNDMYCSHAF